MRPIQKPIFKYSLATLFVAITIVAVGMAVFRYVARRSVDKLRQAVLQQRETRSEAEAVRRWGASKEAVRVLIPLLKSPEQDVRSNASWALYRLGAPATEEMLNWLPDSEMGGCVAVHLAGRKDELAPVLKSKLLNAPNTTERTNVAILFLQSAAGHAAMTRDEALLLASVAHNDPSTEVRMVCIQALGYVLKCIPEVTPEVVPALVDITNSAVDVDVVSSAARLTGQIDSTQFDEVSDRLAELLSSSDPQDRNHGVAATSWFGAHAARLLPVLKELTADPDERVRSAAREAIKSMEENAK